MRILFLLLFFIPVAALIAKPLPPTNQNPLRPNVCDIELGPDITVCNNAVFTLNPHPASGGIYTWSSSPGLSCTVCPSPVVSGLTTGMYTYIATFTTPDCTDTDTLHVIVIDGQAPAYQIADDREICAGDSVQLGGPAFPGIAYNWISVPPGFVSFASNPKVKPNNPITYFLIVSDTASSPACPLLTKDSVKITPISLTLTVSPAGPAAICKGKSVIFQASTQPGGLNIDWSPGSGLQITGNGATAVASPQGSTSYTVSASLGGCTRTKQVAVTVDSLPPNLFIQPSDTTLCQGAQASLTSPPFNAGQYPGITFQWTPLLGLLTPGNSYNAFVQPTQTTLYRRVTQFGKCADTTFSLIILAPPAEMHVLPKDTAICPGQSVQFLLDYTPGIQNIEWQTSGGTLSCTQCESPLATPVTTQTYVVKGDILGCPVQDSAKVNLLPLAPLKFPDDRKLCPGDTVFLNEIFDPGASYTWTSTHPGFGTVVEGAPWFVPKQSAFYRVLRDNGCVALDSVFIEVATADLNVAGDTTICKNFKTRLTAIASVAGTYQWQNNTTGQIEGSGQTLDVMPPETTTYTLLYTFGDNCTLSDDVTVTIDGEAPTIVPPLDANICPGDSVVLNTGFVLPGAQYLWTAVPPDPGLAATAPGPKVSPAEKTTYTVEATLGNCKVKENVIITAANASLSVVEDTVVCAGTFLTLSASGTASDGSYQWSNGIFGPEITVLPDKDTTYTVTYTYGDGCTIEKTVNVSVIPSFALSIKSFPVTDTLDVGESVLLTGVVQPSQSLANFQFDWQVIGTDTEDLPEHTESVEVIVSSNDTSLREIRYRLTATSPNGCVQVTEKRFFIVFPLVVFPNAFTPNGDGTNDVFQMEIIKGAAYVATMQIFNRWGQLVFNSNDETAAWDGTVDGIDAPVDVYVYRVWWRRGDDALQMLAKGDVTLLR